MVKKNNFKFRMYRKQILLCVFCLVSHFPLHVYQISVCSFV